MLLLSILFCFVELFFEFVHSFFECFGLAFGEVDSYLKHLVREPSTPHEDEGCCEWQCAPKQRDNTAEGKDNEGESSDYPKG